MKKNALIAVTALVVLAAIAFGVRAFLRASNEKAAVLTPAMNVHREFSDALAPRIYRALHSGAAPVPSGGAKLIALTFDDGPYPIFTPLLLDMLRKYHIPATFFLIGRDAEQWPEITRRIEEDGNEIGNHTYSHPNLDQETPAEVREEVLRGRDVLWSIAHDPAVKSLMRPPHGRYTLTTLRTVQGIGYHVVLWTDDSGDRRTLTPQHIANDMLRHASAPDIVLLHSGKLATIEALPTVIEHFRRAGYRFVTVGEMLKLTSPQAINHPKRTAV